LEFQGIEYVATSTVGADNRVEVSFLNATAALKFVDFETYQYNSMTDEQVAARIREQLELVIFKSNLQVDQYREQKELNVETSLTPEQFAELLQYREQVRAYLLSSFNPRNPPPWPQRPSFLPEFPKIRMMFR